MRRVLLGCGVAAPVLYFLTLIGASMTWPGYSHVTQYASELGSAAAPYPLLFNSGILLTGSLAVLGGAGVAAHFTGAGRVVSGVLAGAALAAWGAGMIFGGLHPMPDPLHNGFGLVFGVVLLPLFLMIALRGQAGPRTYALLALWLAAMIALLAVMFGVGGLVTTRNVGLWQRALALAMIPGIGVACLFLLRRQSPDR
jgi:hypothetical membrane protein